MSATGYKYIYKTVGKTGKVKFQLKIWDGTKSKQYGVFNTLEEAIKARGEFLKKLGLTLYLDK